MKLLDLALIGAGLLLLTRGSHGSSGPTSSAPSNLPVVIPTGSPAGDVVINNSTATLGGETYTEPAAAIKRLQSGEYFVIHGFIVPSGPFSPSQYGINLKGPVGPYAYIPGTRNIIESATGKLVYAQNW